MIEIKNALRIQNYTSIISEDNTYNAPNLYYVRKRSDDKMLQSIVFQTGPIPEKGVNGVNIEDLIVICMDRLQNFQKSGLDCRENAIAITKLQESLMWLNKRTQDRILREVEGKMEK